MQKFRLQFDTDFHIFHILQDHVALIISKELHEQQKNRVQFSSVFL